jgi:hypothetical protein
MTSLIQGVTNATDGYASHQIDEYWMIMEKSAYIQQSESRSYLPLVKTVPKEGGNSQVMLTSKSLLMEF